MGMLLQLHSAPKGKEEKDMHPPMESREFELDGYERRFKIYVPKACRGHKSPLILSLHGASGPRMQEISAWDLIAEREHILVAYPEAHMPERWNIWERSSNGIDDIAYLDKVLDLIQKEFEVDEERIYIHGHSMGDNMATEYIYQRGQTFAAAFLTGGPVLPTVMLDEAGRYRVYPQSALTVGRFHGECDIKCGFPSTHNISNELYEAYASKEEQRDLRFLMDQMQKDLWMDINGCAKEPKLYLAHDFNLEYYQGGQEDFLFFSIPGGVHKPGYNMAELAWEYVFSRYKRENGRTVRLLPLEAAADMEPQILLCACTEGSMKIWTRGSLRKLEEPFVRKLEDTCYVSMEGLMAMFPDTQASVGEEKEECLLLYKEHRLRLAEGRQLALIDNRIMDVPVIRKMEEQLWIPLERVVQNFYEAYLTVQGEVIFITGRPATVTYDIARDMRILLGKDQKPKPDWKLELELLDRIQTRSGSHD